MYKYFAIFAAAGSIAGVVFGWGSLGFIIGGSIGYFIDSRERSRTNVKFREAKQSGPPNTIVVSKTYKFLYTPHQKDAFVSIGVFTLYFSGMNILYSSSVEMAVEWMEFISGSHSLLAYVIPSINYQYEFLMNAKLENLAVFVRHMLSVAWVFGIFFGIWLTVKYKFTIQYFKDGMVKGANDASIKGILSVVLVLIIFGAATIVFIIVSYLGYDVSGYIQKPGDFAGTTYTAGFGCIALVYSIYTITTLVIAMITAR